MIAKYNIIDLIKNRNLIVCLKCYKKIDEIGNCKTKGCLYEVRWKMIGGSLEAKCKECKCCFIWNMDDFPFVNSMIIGTCDKCLNKINHNCYDEFQLTKDRNFVLVGKKIFENTIWDVKNGNMRSLWN